jgi:lipopolysaccharide export system protein LptC
MTADGTRWSSGIPAGLIWLVTVGFVMAGAVLFFEPFEDMAPATPVARAPDDPDLTLEQALITRFRESGTLKYRLRSPLIEHFESGSLTRMESPELELHSQPDPPWHMTASRGTISNVPDADGGTEERVLLDENVRMEQRFEDGRQFELRTPSATVFPDREYAETSRNVMITTHAGRTTAVGLQGDLDRGLVHLFSDADQRVHTILLPDQFK